MTNAFSLTATGLDKVLERLDKVNEALREDVDEELNDSANRVASNARKNFQTLTAGFSDVASRKTRKIKRSTGTLEGRISANTSDKFNKEVVAQAKYAPFVEFGTGALVEVPKGLEDYAAQFKGKGVKKVNLPARPFMFPALMDEVPVMVKNITNVLVKK